MNTFEQIPQQPQEEKEQMEITNTATFQDALKSGGLKEAAVWLDQVKSKHNERWLDHRSRELMKALCEAGRLDEAEKYVDDAKDEEGREGRRKKIERLRSQ